MNWDQYYIGIAHAVKAKSKDPSTQVGAVIVDSQNRPVSFGFNGFPKGIDEKLMTFERPMKYRLTIHAERNAMIFAKQDLTGCTVYTTHAPCSDCLLHLVQAGINKIIYDEDGPSIERGSEENLEAIRRILTGYDHSFNRHVLYAGSIRGENMLLAVTKKLKLLGQPAEEGSDGSNV